MKKKLTILLALVMVFSLTACGGNNEKELKEDVKTEEKTEVKMEELEEKGEGTVTVELDKLYIDKDTVLEQFGYETKGLNPNNLTFIYVDDNLVAKEQLGDSQGVIELEGNLLKQGKHNLVFKQYENDDEKSEPILLKYVEFEIVNK